MRWKIIITALILIAVIAVPSAYFLPQILNPPEPESFIVDSILLKTAIKSNGSYNSQIKVANMLDIPERFEILIEDIGNFVTIDSKPFSLEPRELKTLDLKFSNGKSEKEGIYTGSLIIKNSRQEKLIPIIIEIESDDVLFDSNVNLFPASDSSGKITAEINIFDLSNIGTANIEADYFIKSFSGNIVSNEKENIVVKNSLLLTKSFQMPENIERGDYIFGVVLKYKNSVGTSAYLFKLADINAEKKPIISTNTMMIIGFLVLIFILLFFLFYSLYSRDRILVELKNQYKEEIERQESLLGLKERQNDARLKTTEERNLNRRIFKKIKEERKEAIKKMHKERIIKIKKLKKASKKGEIQRQIKEWKKQGYNTEVLERKIKAPGAEDIRKQIKEWKKKGYNTKVLEGKI